MIVAVVVTYNRQDLLERCVASLLSQTRPVDHVLIVDNGTDGAGASLARGDSQVRVLELPQNPGPAGGFSAGIQAGLAAGADALWLFNDDAWAEPGALAALEEAAPADAAMIGSAFHADGTLRIAGGDWCDGLVRHRTDLPFGAPMEPVDLVIFNGALLKGAAARDVAPPREDFWMMFEEWEYCVRLREAGFQNYLLPVPLIHHDWGGAEAGKRPYYQTRNHLRMVLERRRRRELAAFTARTLKFTVADALNQKWSSVRHRLRGVRDGLARTGGRTV